MKPVRSHGASADFIQGHLRDAASSFAKVHRLLASGKPASEKISQKLSQEREQFLRPILLEGFPERTFREIESRCRLSSHALNLLHDACLRSEGSQQAWNLLSQILWSLEHPLFFREKNAYRTVSIDQIEAMLKKLLDKEGWPGLMQVAMNLDSAANSLRSLALEIDHRTRAMRKALAHAPGRSWIPPGPRLRRLSSQETGPQPSPQETTEPSP